MLMRLRLGILFSLGFFVNSCSDEPEVTGPLNSSLLPAVRYVSLVPDAYSNQNVMVLSETAVFGLTMHQFDKDQKLLYRNIPSKTEVSVSDGTMLKHPFIFRPQKSGVYTFTLQGYPAPNVLNATVKVVVTDDVEYDQVSLPVIFHYFASSDESVSASVLGEKIRTQLELVNKAYANRNGSRDPNSVTTAISFELATTDPEGNLLEVPGLHILRASQVKFKDSSDETLNSIIWDGNFWSPRKYINVWMPRFEGNYSWARFPFLGSSAAEFPSSAFGTYLKFEHLAFPSVLAHEFGHMLNLYHNFDNDCSGDIDRCSDTRDYQRDYSADYKGGLLRKDCKGVEFNGVNYMDYYPTENNTFTFEQRKRMRTTLAQCPFLPTPANLAGRSVTGKSHSGMRWSVAPESLAW